MLYTGHGGTHSRSGGVVPPRNSAPERTGFPKPCGASVVNRGEHEILSRCVEVSGARNLSPLDNATRWQRGTAILFLDDSQSEGGSGGCIVCFYNPRFVLLDANGGIVTDGEFLPLWHRLVVPVHRETTRSCEIGVKSDDDRLDGHPSLITSHIRCGG